MAILQTKLYILLKQLVKNAQEETPCPNSTTQRVLTHPAKPTAAGPKCASPSSGENLNLLRPALLSLRGVLLWGTQVSCVNSQTQQGLKPSLIATTQLFKCFFSILPVSIPLLQSVYTRWNSQALEATHLNRSLEESHPQGTTFMLSFKPLHAFEVFTSCNKNGPKFYLCLLASHVGHNQEQRTQEDYLPI